MRKNRQLKKMLSLVTILAMLFSCMAITAGAAYEDDFTSKQTYVASGPNANNNYYGSALQCGRDVNNDESIAMAYFDVSNLQGTVKKATIQIGLNSPYYQIMACDILGSWNAETVTWNNKPVIAPYGYTGTEIAARVVEIDITQMVQKWCEGENYGVALRGYQGSHNIYRVNLYVETEAPKDATTYVTSGSYGNTNYYGSGSLQCGIDANKNESLVMAYFDVSDVQGTVSQATLKVNINSPYYQMMACDVLGPWKAETVTWNNKPVVAPYGNIGTEVAPHVVYIDVTQMVQNWRTGNNYGVAIRGFQGFYNVNGVELLIETA